MQLTIIIIGDEILLGRVTDTNSGFISRTLDPYGFSTQRVVVVGDDAAQIKRAIVEALAESDLVITTGGLGPTKDDITKNVLCELYGCDLVHDESVAENVASIFERKGLKMNVLTASQAMVPAACHVIQNIYGTAPVMWFDRDGKVLIAMPGVPYETEGMMRGEVLECIRARFSPSMHYAHATVVTSGISESALAERLAAFEETLPSCAKLAYLPASPIIKLRLDVTSSVDAESLCNELQAKLIDEVKDVYVATGDKSIGRIVLDALERTKLTLATAESCTGGSIAAAVTAEPGASEWFMGGVVSYANSVKQGILDVSNESLHTYGAVSRQVVEQMLAGVCRATGSDCAVATSGIAGPGGGTPDKPVGTVWIGVRTPVGIVTEVHHFPGSRERVIERARTTALLLLVKELNKRL